MLQIVFEEKHHDSPVEKESDFFDPELHQVSLSAPIDQQAKLFEVKVSLYWLSIVFILHTHIK